MLPGMFRVALIAVVFAGCSCSKSAGNQEKASPSDPGPGPGPKVVTPTPAAPIPDDPKMHLKPDEGTLTIDKAEGPAGAAASAAVKVTPAKGFHMSTDYPIKLSLEAPAGVKLDKAEYNSGKGAQGDASEFGEKGLAFTVKATADKAGEYTINGTLKFGVCDDQSCHPKRQPITITVAAK